MKQEKYGLAALERQIQRELKYLNYPTENWVKPVVGSKGEAVLDVAVIGGGMCGMAVAVSHARGFQISGYSMAETRGARGLGSQLHG